MSQFHAIDVPSELIHAAAGGDAAAHAAIYRSCNPAVHSLIRRLVPRRAVADELFQEVFVEILRNVATYSGQGSFGGWVRSIAVNKCLAYLRSPWHRRLFWMDAQEDADAPFVLIDAALQPDAQAADRADLERALAQLPTLARSVVWLHDVEGYTHEEIGDMLGRTPSFSKSQLARSHARLRELLDPATPIRTGRRIRFAAAVVATASTVALLVFIGVERWRGSRVPQAPLAPLAAQPREPTLDQLVAQSRQLDDLLQELPLRPRAERVVQAATLDTLEQRIQWLDFQLSFEAEAELNPEQARSLWRERVDLMDSLVKVRYAQVQDY